MNAMRDGRCGFVAIVAMLSNKLYLDSAAEGVVDSNAAFFNWDCASYNEFSITVVTAWKPFRNFAGHLKPILLLWGPYWPGVGIRRNSKDAKRKRRKK